MKRLKAKKASVTFLFAVCIFASSAWAHPVRKIEIEYDHAQKILHVSVPHLSKNLREDYVRKLVVFQNGQEVETKHYRMQEEPQGLTEDINVKAAAADQFVVKVLVSEGGSYEETYVVPELQEKDGKKQADQPAETSEMPSQEQNNKGY